MSVALAHVASVELPAHMGEGGFDHAGVHLPTGLVYVAHTANDAIDVLDPEAGRYTGSVGGLRAVAGALVTDSQVFTSNRGENSVAVFAPGAEREGRTPASLRKLAVGVRPNGLAYAPSQHRLLAAHVGDPAIPGSCTVSVIDVAAWAPIAELPMPGRTRWTVFDPVTERFFVNIAAPACIVVIGARGGLAIERAIEMPSAGPHGLDLDVARRRLYCACDGGTVFALDADSGAIVADAPLAGPPDVIFVDEALARLYVAVGTPGVLEVFDTAPLRKRATIDTAPGAHTFAFDAKRHLVTVFLPVSHRAAVYRAQ
ncbi:MAG TPA: YncE family protein [Terriglobales bacterium]|nr:YncE family protein [Terriglobales bacterium]